VLQCRQYCCWGVSFSNSRCFIQYCSCICRPVVTLNPPRPPPPHTPSHTQPQSCCIAKFNDPTVCIAALLLRFLWLPLPLPQEKAAAVDTAAADNGTTAAAVAADVDQRCCCCFVAATDCCRCCCSFCRYRSPLPSCWACQPCSAAAACPGGSAAPAATLLLLLLLLYSNPRSGTPTPPHTFPTFPSCAASAAALLPPPPPPPPPIRPPVPHLAPAVLPLLLHCAVRWRCGGASARSHW